MPMPKLVLVKDRPRKRKEVPITPNPVREREKPLQRVKDQNQSFRSPNALSHLLQKDKEVVKLNQEREANKPATPFSQEQLDELWKSYVGARIDQKNRSLFITLNQRTPKLLSDYKLEFPVENKVQKQQIEDVALDLVFFLRKKLNNYSIMLDVPVTNVPKQKKHYSAEERYKYLAEKYPAIELLRKKLDLDIDY